MYKAVHGLVLIFHQIIKIQLKDRDFRSESHVVTCRMHPLLSFPFMVAH